MTKPIYTASLSQSQGRSGYSIIFRHPARHDDATNKSGVRVRRGLGTRDEAEADRLKAELNELLADPKYYVYSAKAEAERLFDSRVVDIFFNKMTPEHVDYPALREEEIPLPASGPDGYRRALLLGTTGAGKTTLVRQFIGTDPLRERFPSTSTAKTTIHDTEIVLDEGPWRVAVTFVSSDEVREHLNECISASVLAAANGADDAVMIRRLLNHVNQRFRFSYVLGNGPETEEWGFDFGDEEEKEEDVYVPASEDLEDIVDLAATNALLSRAMSEIRVLANRLGGELRDELKASEDDERVLDELFEEELDNRLRDEDTFHEIADDLMDEIEKRFTLLPPGSLTKTKQGWPIIWSGEWPVEDRGEFLKIIPRFSGNYAPSFGRLLTPLVNGVRVAGPFKPDWLDGEVPKLVLLDGEGLGHTPKFSAAVSTSVSRLIDSVDAVILVDNATQPMQAASIAAMREVIATGNARKLVLAFTHFDEVKGDNLPNASSKASHVMSSAENVLRAFGEQLGSYAERALRGRIENASYFLSDINEMLTQDSVSGRRTISQLRRLLNTVDQVLERPQSAAVRPVYDRMNLTLAIHAATGAFHAAWWPLLGLEHKPGFSKEHWTRIKALSRRLANQWADEYDSLKPVADLRQELVDRIYVFIQSPLRWEGSEPSEEDRQNIYDELAESLGRRLLNLSTRRVWRERTREWEDAYSRRGIGSTFDRARIIGDQIYEPAAPVPSATPSRDRNRFLHEVVAEMEEAVEEIGAKLQ